MILDVIEVDYRRERFLKKRRMFREMMTATILQPDGNRRAIFHYEPRLDFTKQEFDEQINLHRAAPPDSGICWGRKPWKEDVCCADDILFYRTGPVTRYPRDCFLTVASIEDAESASIMFGCIEGIVVNTLFVDDMDVDHMEMAEYYLFSSKGVVFKQHVPCTPKWRRRHPPVLRVNRY